MGWDKDPAAFGDVVRTDAEQLQKKVVLMLMRRIIYRTPVDTGRARGNWLVKHNTPSTRVLKTADKSGLKSMARAERVNPKLGGIIWISNNLDYIMYLEDGTDKFAPFAMVAGAVQSVRAKMRSI